MTKQQQIDELEQLIKDKKVCPDLAASATQLVMGDGSLDADIVFIGEAPGKKEDETGVPFVGAAGQFLDNMLESVNLKRSDVYITNIVKYRPPDNRDPLPEEKSEFMPYLERQLAIIEPKLVVTLGRHSMNMFLPDLKISQEHGQPKRKKFSFVQDKPRETSLLGDNEHRSESYQEYDERDAQLATKQDGSQNDGVASSSSERIVRSWVILPLYHPAAALYNGSMRQTLLDDFAKVPKILQQIEH